MEWYSCHCKSVTSLFFSWRLRRCSMTRRWRSIWCLNFLVLINLKMNPWMHYFPSLCICPYKLLHLKLVILCPYLTCWDEPSKGWWQPSQQIVLGIFLSHIWDHKTYESIDITGAGSLFIACWYIQKPSTIIVCRSNGWTHASNSTTMILSKHI